MKKKNALQMIYYGNLYSGTNFLFNNVCRSEVKHHVSSYSLPARGIKFYLNKDWDKNRKY